MASFVILAQSYLGTHGFLVGQSGEGNFAEPYLLDAVLKIRNVAMSVSPIAPAGRIAGGGVMVSGGQRLKRRQVFDRQHLWRDEFNRFEPEHRRARIPNAASGDGQSCVD